MTITLAKIDLDQTQQQLRLLGYAENEPLFLRFINPSTGKALKKRLTHIQNYKSLQGQGFNVYIVVNGGGHNDGQVKNCRAIFYEHDDLDKDLQLNLWQTLGLPVPTFQVDTGGKSIHSYWVFEQPIEKAEWKSLQTDLLEMADADRTIKNPSRVMRLAGFRYFPKGEAIAHIVTANGTRYNYETLREIIPTSPPATPPPNNVVQLRRTVSTGEVPPMTAFLSKSDRDLIANGAQTGGRNATGAKLARGLIGTGLRLEHLGISFTDEPYALFIDYCQRCSPSPDWNQKEWESIWHKAQKANPTATLTDDALENCRKAWERNQGRAKREAPRDKPPIIDITSTTDEPIPEDELPDNKIGNLMKAIRRLGIQIRWNAKSLQPEMNGEPLDFQKLRGTLALKGNKLESMANVETAAMAEAYENEYNPITDYLDQCFQKHGANPDLLYSLSSKILGTSHQIHNTFLAKTLIAAVARAYQPGCEHRTVLVLQGPQECGKSSFFKKLASPAWFEDGMGSQSDKDEKLKLHKAWIVEWAELESVFSRKETAQVKAFISSATDNIRAVYGKLTIERKRSSIIVGSTNEDSFLADPTGNSRYWVIPCRKKIDLTTLDQLRDQIWAAAVAAYQSNTVDDHRSPWKLTPEEKRTAEAIASEFTTQDPWEDKVMSGLEFRDYITISEILEKIVGLDLARQDASHQRRISAILRRNGWTNDKRREVAGKRVRVWSKPTETDHLTTTEPTGGSFAGQSQPQSSSTFQEDDPARPVKSEKKPISSQAPTSTNSSPQQQQKQVFSSNQVGLLDHLPRSQSGQGLESDQQTAQQPDSRWSGGQGHKYTIADDIEFRLWNAKNRDWFECRGGIAHIEGDRVTVWLAGKKAREIAGSGQATILTDQILRKIPREY